MLGLWNRALSDSECASSLGMLRAVCFAGHPAGAASRSASESMGKGIQAQGTILSGTGCCGKGAKAWMQTWSCIGRKLITQELCL